MKRLYQAEITFNEPAAAMVSLLADNEEDFRKDVESRLTGVHDLTFVAIEDLGEMSDDMVENQDSPKAKILH